MQPLILVTNDDGIQSPGIQTLSRALSELGEVVVVAPDQNRSGSAHMLTLLKPIRVWEVKPGWFSAEGSPADCVYLAIVELIGRPINLVVSGINAGPNLSHDVHYSGTVAAAIEGTLFEIPSFAVSLTDPHTGSYEHAARFARNLATLLLETGGLPVGTTLNVNIPKGEPNQHQMTYLGHRSYRHSVHKRLDPRGLPYYWIGGMPDQPRDLPGSDCNAIAQGLISITPLTIDTTDTKFYAGPWSKVEIKGSSVVASQPPPANTGYDPSARR